MTVQVKRYLHSGIEAADYLNSAGMPALCPWIRKSALLAQNSTVHCGIK